MFFTNFLVSYKNICIRLCKILFCLCNKLIGNIAVLKQTSFCLQFSLIMKNYVNYHIDYEDQTFNFIFRWINGLSNF